jgi:hypothetical protein
MGPAVFANADGWKCMHHLSQSFSVSSSRSSRSHTCNEEAVASVSIACVAMMFCVTALVPAPGVPTLCYHDLLCALYLACPALQKGTGEAQFLDAVLSVTTSMLMLVIAWWQEEGEKGEMHTTHGSTTLQCTSKICCPRATALGLKGWTGVVTETEPTYVMSVMGRLLRRRSMPRPEV